MVPGGAGVDPSSIANQALITHCSLSVPSLVLQAALLWCLAVQECAMYVDWPVSALRHWPEESDGHTVLFRGPRWVLGAVGA